MCQRLALAVFWTGFLLQPCKKKENLNFYCFYWFAGSLESPGVPWSSPESPGVPGVPGVPWTHLPPQTVSFPNELVEDSATHCYLRADALAACLVQAAQAPMVEGVIAQGLAIVCDSNIQYQPVGSHGIHFRVPERSRQCLLEELRCDLPLHERGYILARESIREDAFSPSIAFAVRARHLAGRRLRPATISLSGGFQFLCLRAAVLVERGGKCDGVAGKERPGLLVVEFSLEVIVMNEASFIGLKLFAMP